MKKKTKIIIGVVAGVLVLGAIANGGKSNNSSTSKTVESEVSSEAVASTVESEVAVKAVESEISIEMIDDATKESIKSAIEPLISDEYKTYLYTFDVLTPSEGSGGIVSVSIESPSFIDKETAVSTVVDIISSSMELPEYSDIYSFDFGMISDYQLKYFITLSSPADIKDASEIESHLTIQDCSKDSNDNTESTTDQEDTADSSSKSSDLTMGQKNALASAKSYLSFTGFSHDGLIEQLEYEQYSTEDATYAADNCGADWNEQALIKAKEYLDFSAFSYSGLIEQLEYEKFTKDEATYAADNCGADWNEQAAAKAKSYMDYSSFSKNELIDQLKYEGFTAEQAAYGVEANGY